MSLHALFLYVIGQRKDDDNDSHHKGQHVFPRSHQDINKRTLLNRNRKHVPVEFWIGCIHGRRQRRVCADLGGRIQPLSGDYQEASFPSTLNPFSRAA